MADLLAIDITIFYLINSSLANPVLDLLMPIITNLKNWRIPILLIWLILMIKGGRKGRVAALLIIPVLVFCDQMSAAVLKPWVGRIRPCHVLENVRVLTRCGGKLAFPSSHATNIAGFATILTLIFRHYWGWFWGVAIVVGFSRIYVGVHYPLDVMGGFILGSAISILVFVSYQYLGVIFPKISLYYQNSGNLKNNFTHRENNK